MLKRLFPLVILLAVTVVFVGCGTKDPATNEPKQDSQSNQEAKPKLPADLAAETDVDEDTILIGYVAMTNGSAQAFINQKYPIFEEHLKPLGKKVKFVAAHGLQEVYPLLDKKQGAPDFFYIPHTAFTTYVTETSRFGGSRNYTIIGGSINLNDVNLVTRPEIKTLKDLDGKTVGIANKRYADGYQLEQVLATVGLKTTTNGGTVTIIWDDIIGKLWDNYKGGKYDAIVNFDNATNLPKAVALIPGSNVISLNPDGMFGEKQPRVLLVGKKELIEQKPEIVQALLKGHIVSSDKAKKNMDELAAINREERMAWFIKRGTDKAQVEAENPPEKFQKAWKQGEITYTTDMKYFTGLYDYMVKNGWAKDLNLKDFIQTEPLNETLKDMGRPELEGAK